MPRKRKVGRPRKTHKRKKKQRGGALLTTAAGILAPIAIDVIATSIATKKPVAKVLANKFK